MGGPIVLGRPEDGDVLRLEGFLRRNSHPHQLLNPETDAPAKALIERFHIDSGQLPIVLCPGGQLLLNPGEDELARCLSLVRSIDPKRLYDVAVIGAGPASARTVGFATRTGKCGIRLRTQTIRKSARWFSARCMSAQRVDSQCV